MSTPPEKRLADYIALMAELPVLPRTFPVPAQETLYNIVRFRYKAISTWLRTLLLAEPLAPEAIETDMKYFQPVAEFSADSLRFIIEVYTRSGDPLIRAFTSPAALWMTTEIFRSIRLLHAYGIKGAAPSPVGKRFLLSQLIKNIDALADNDWSKFSTQGAETESTPARGLGTTLEATLHLEAGRLALADPSFDKAHYRPYIKKMKRFLNEMRNNKEMQLCWVDEYGELVQTAKNHRLPQKEGKPRLGRRSEM